jgi:ketosteroid isomerase-like protein
MSRRHIDLLQDLYAEIPDWVETGQFTVVRDGGRIRGSESSVYNEFTHLWTFREDLVIRWAAFTDKSQALEAVGLEE